jgi:glycine betaine catabolism B
VDFNVSLLQVIDRGGGCVSFRFERPSGFSFIAGQYGLFRLSDTLVHAFSFSNSPTEEGYLEFTTKMSESDYKKRLMTLKTGDKVKITGPMGEFVYGGQNKVVFLAGGIGITPFRSIIKYLTDSRSDCDIVLLWGVNTLDDAIFKGDFDEMSSKNPELKAVYVPAKPPAGWAQRSGYITKECITEEVADYGQRTFFVCGPSKMVEVMDSLLAGLGVAKEKVIVEQFGGY